MQQETIETSMAKDWFFLFKEKKTQKKEHPLETGFGNTADIQSTYETQSLKHQWPTINFKTIRVSF